jgi:hypothetical protein
MLYLKGKCVQDELFTSLKHDFHQSLGTTNISVSKPGPSVRRSERLVGQNFFCIRFKFSCAYYQD